MFAMGLVPEINLMKGLSRSNEPLRHIAIEYLGKRYR